MLNPQAERFLERLARAKRRPIHEISVEEARRQADSDARAVNLRPQAVAEVTDVVIEGDPAVRGRIYDPDPKENRGVIVYFHGGGWVTESVDTYDGLLRRLANATSRLVLGVDYRLAPEHPFPAAVEDAVAAFRWARDRWGPARPVSVAGDSAGGNLAAVVARRCRDGGEPLPAGQVLIYPATDLTMRAGSHSDLAEGYGFTAAHLAWAMSLYLPDLSMATHPDASPHLAADVGGLPPALIITAEYDPVRDEGEAYARRLEEAGVPVVLRRFEGQIHGFVGRPDFEDAARALAVSAEFLDVYSRQPTAPPGTGSSQPLSR